jgi:hypothetical protein
MREEGPGLLMTKAKPVFTLDHAKRKTWVLAFLDPAFVAAKSPDSLDAITDMLAHQQGL